MCGMEGYIAYEWVSYVNVLSEDPPADQAGISPATWEPRPREHSSQGVRARERAFPFSPSLFALNNHSSHFPKRHVITANLLNLSHDFRLQKMVKAE